jgi:hypothetical protein
MPKRSNEFQRLVAMLTMLKSDGATVYESVEVMKIASEERREVKILVSSSGFTTPALTKAARYGIKTITAGEVTPEFVGKIINSADSAEYWH